MRWYKNIPIWENSRRIKLLTEFRSLIVEYFNNVERTTFLRTNETKKSSQIRSKINMVIELSPHSLHSRNLYMLIANGQRVDLPRSAC